MNRGCGITGRCPSKFILFPFIKHAVLNGQTAHTKGCLEFLAPPRSIHTFNPLPSLQSKIDRIRSIEKSSLTAKFLGRASLKQDPLKSATWSSHCYFPQTTRNGHKREVKRLVKAEKGNRERKEGSTGFYVRTLQIYPNTCNYNRFSW